MKFAGQSVANLLKQFGVKLPEKTEAKSRNAAAVMVSASFPSGYRRGQSIDITVSSLGDAKSLRGGTLLLTEDCTPPTARSMRWRKATWS